MSESETEPKYGLAAAIAALLPGIPFELGQCILDIVKGTTSLELLTMLGYEEIQEAFLKFYGKKQYMNHVDEMDELYELITGNSVMNEETDLHYFFDDESDEEEYKKECN